MRNPNRLDAFYDKFKQLHKECFPDWRFGQLIINFFGTFNSDPWFYEEDKMLELFEDYCNKYGRLQ